MPKEHRRSTRTSVTRIEYTVEEIEALLNEDACDRLGSRDEGASESVAIEVNLTEYSGGGIKGAIVTVTEHAEES
jgi:hypothetical protein